MQSPSFTPSRDAVRKRWPESLIAFGTFLCAFATFGLAFAPGLLFMFAGAPLSNSWSTIQFFGSIFGSGALAYAAWGWTYRKRMRVWYEQGRELEARQKISNNTTGFFIGAASCAVMSLLASGGLHQNWVRLLLCESASWGASLLLARVLSSPPSPLSVEEASRPSWLPGRAAAMADYPEIRLRSPLGARVVFGLFVIGVMGGITVVCADFVFDPRVFGVPGGSSLRVFCFFLMLGMGFFTYILLGLLASFSLALNLDERAYVEERWKPLPGEYGKRGFVFALWPLRFTGSFDDIAGFRLKEHRVAQDDIMYLLQLVWKDPDRQPYTFRNLETEELAERVMLEASQALGVTPLGTWG